MYKRQLLSELEGRLQAIIGPYGLVLGCALGEDCGYLDLLLFDLPGFLTAAEHIFKAYPYQFYLAELKPGGRIALLER